MRAGTAVAMVNGTLQNKNNKYTLQPLERYILTPWCVSLKYNTITAEISKLPLSQEFRRGTNLPDDIITNMQIVKMQNDLCKSYNIVPQTQLNDKTFRTYVVRQAAWNTFSLSEAGPKQRISLYIKIWNIYLKIWIEPIRNFSTRVEQLYVCNHLNVA